jgi:hypothetical protein
MNLLQGDVHQVALPLLPEAIHPDVEEFKQRIDQRPVEPLLIELTVLGQESMLLEGDESEPGVSFPGWTLLRRLGGEIVEIAGYAVAEEVHKGAIVLGHGRFEGGCLLRTLYRPQMIDSENRIEIGVTASDGEPMRLTLAGPALHEPAWPALVRRFEEAVEQLKAAPRAVPGAGPAPPAPGQLSWQDEVRALELDDATRRSVERRRASTLEYQEASEDVGFKGTMTLVGCALLWLIPVLLLVASWFPQLAWLIVPVLLGFLGLQVLRWLVPTPPPSDDQSR